MVEALKRGAEEFITKPFDETEVLNTLNKVINQQFFGESSPELSPFIREKFIRNLQINYCQFHINVVK